MKILCAPRRRYDRTHSFPSIDRDATVRHRPKSPGQTPRIATRRRPAYFCRFVYLIRTGSRAHRRIDRGRATNERFQRSRTWKRRSPRYTYIYIYRADSRPTVFGADIRVTSPSSERPNRIRLTFANPVVDRFGVFCFLIKSCRNAISNFVHVSKFGKENVRYKNRYD